MNIPSNFKPIIGYLTALKNSSAIYNKNFELLWTNDNDFFGGFNLDDVKSSLPMREETLFSVMAGGERQALSVSPIFKGKYAASGYVFILKSGYQIYKMAEKTDIPLFADKLGNHLRDNTEKLRELNEKAKADILLKKSLSQAEASVGEQGRYISMLANEMEIDKLVFIKEKNNTSCNITALLNVLFNQLSDYYKCIQRKITFQLADKGFYNSFDYNILSAALLQVVKYHTCTSPLKSGIAISGEFYDKGLYQVTFKSKKCREGEENDEGLSEYYLALAKKIFLFDFEGDFLAEKSDKYCITTAKFPVFKKNRGALVALSRAGYLGEDFKPCNIVLKEQVSKEIRLLEQIKMETATKKKLAQQED